MLKTAVMESFSIKFQAMLQAGKVTDNSLGKSLIWSSRVMQFKLYIYLKTVLYINGTFVT